MQQNSQYQKYAFIAKYVNLPSRRPLNPLTEKLFSQNNQTANNDPSITPQLKSMRNSILTSLQNQTFIFNDPKSYNFQFPPSMFPDIVSQNQNQSNDLSYEKPIQIQQQQQEIFGTKLNSQQLQQIRQKGQFQVPSKLAHAKIPYIWKINDWIVRGKVNIRKVWENGLACCLNMLQSAFDFFIEVVPKSLWTIFGLPKKLINLLFGLKSIRKFYTPNYDKQIAKDFWNDILENQLKNLNKQIGHQFLQAIYLKPDPNLSMYSSYEYQQELKGYNKNQIQAYRQKQKKINAIKQHLLQLQQNFKPIWTSQKQKILPRLLNQPNNSMISNKQINKQSKQQIQSKLHDEKFRLFTVYMQRNINQSVMSRLAVEALVRIMLIVNFINGRILQKDLYLSKLRQKITQQVQAENPIRSKLPSFTYKRSQQLYQKQKAKYQQQFYNKLSTDPQFTQYLPQNYLSIYQKYLKYRNFYPTLLQQKKSRLKCLYQPTRIFKSTYMHLPPYQIIASRTNNSTGQKYYSLKRQQQLYTDTSFHFWKIALYCMRLKTWTINWVVVMIGLAWVGPFGLRCLCGIEDFQYDQTINNTGEKGYLKRKTVLGQFGTVLDGIRRSRQNFQAQPDQGLLGKCFTRFCNYIECYIFRLFFVGVIGVLTLYPIAIVLFSIVCFILVLTVWIWVPIAMLACYLFNILIFQFQISFAGSTECIIRSVPLISLFFRLVFAVLTIIFCFLLLLVFAPLGALFYFLFLILQRAFRTITDCIMVCVISICGRTPRINTCAAQKISGPGMAQNYFSSIDEKDLHVLVQAELQKKFMNKFRQLTQKQIEKPSIQYNKKLKFVLQPFGHSYTSLNSNQNHVQNNKIALQQNFNKKSSLFMRRYPKNPYNVRLTGPQLQTFFANSTKLVRNYVQNQYMQKWLFQQMSINNKNYEQMTKALWRQVFNYGGDQIFQPIQQLQKRIILNQNVTSNTTKMRNNMQAVMSALQGQVIQIPKTLQFTAQSNNNNNIQDRQISIIREIFQYNSRNNTGNSLVFDVNDPKCIIFVPRNIKDVEQYARKSVEETRKQKERNHVTVLQYNQ